MLQLESIDPRSFGKRIVEARKARGVTQKEVAEFLGCSRPTYIAIEKGERPLNPDEVRKIASFLGQRVHELVRPAEPVVDLQPHLRAVVGKIRAADEQQLYAGIDELQRFAEDYRELERLANAQLPYNYPPTVELGGRIDPAQLAESISVRERQRLGLGDQPVSNLRSLLELDVGLRIFYGVLPSNIAGMYAYTTDLGCCILINRNHPAEKRRASMLHEYGHLIVDRYQPGIDYLTFPGRKPANERFAEQFSLCFLMPTSSVHKRFQEIVTTTGDFQVGDLCRLSHFYFVSVEAMALRLEQLGLMPRGTWQALMESELAPRKAQEMLELPSQPISSDPFSKRYTFLAVQVFEQAKISQGQLARFLRCDPLSAREIVAECRASLQIEESGVSRQLELPFDRSLLDDQR
ncbi:Transcriptional regulator [Planctomycetales bacterium 10988]|nr:Transcriptional regulator [Planctomycetales bacterium 10988]